MALNQLEDYARAAVRIKLRSDKSVGWPLAVIMGIRSLGVTSKDSIARLKPQVLAAIDKRRMEVRQPAAKFSKAYLDGEAPRTATEKAAVEFILSTRFQRRQASKDKRKWELMYGSLEFEVFAFTKSLNTPELDAEPLDLFEVTAIVRSINARKGGITRIENNAKAKQPLSPSMKGKIAAKALREQQSSFL